MLESSPSPRLIFATVLRGANPAQTPGYYRTVSFPVSRVQRHKAVFGKDARPSRKPRVQLSAFGSEP
jgi:hypothetical protein